ncbi:MAG: murein biosynthesis integral membrane protein MurJ [Phycisphaerae bacterium]
MPSYGRFISAAWLIALLTLGSRVLGLVRECVFGYYFSTSGQMSAFRIAFMAPNLARRLFGEGALSSAMIPVLTESLQTQGEESSRRFVGTLLTVLVVVLAAIVLAVEVVIAVWRMVHDDPALELTAVLMPYMVLICTVAVASGVLNVRGHFATPAAAPMILNVGIIACTLGGAAWLGLHGIELMYAVCGGVLLAGAVQLLVTGVALRAISFFPTFSRQWRDPQVRAVVTLMAPMILGLSAVQVNSLVDYLIAYLFITENGERVGPAVLGYAQYLYQLPLGVFGIAIATAIFPVLSQKFVGGDRRGMAEVLGRGIRLSLFIALPASVGLMFVARPLVATLYQRGEFDEGDTQRVAWTLFFYSLGLAAYFTQHIVVRAFYAMHSSKTPARVALWMVAVNFLMNLALVFVLEERGLALATAVCAVIQVIWLSRSLTRELPEIKWRRLGGGIGRILAATGIMAAVLAVVMWLSLGGSLVGEHSLARLGALLLVGIATYALAARALRIEELGMALRRGI